MSDLGLAEENDELASLHADIAAGLAQLSAPGTTPTEVTVSTAGFDCEDVDFDSGGWLVQVVEVQDWLRLDSPIHPSAVPSEIAAHLFRSLGVDEAPFAVSDGGVVRPSPAALERARERVDAAVQNRGRFKEALEAGDSVQAATAAWVEMWEATYEEDSTGPVEATATTWPIQNFADRAKSGRLELSPSYQRGDVWPIKDSQMLIESILRGIPLPSVIILNPSNDDDRPFEVVDGKQRLTAILRFTGSHPKALETVRAADRDHPTLDLLRLFSEDYPKFRTAWKNATLEQLTATREKDLYFPFKLRKAGSTLEGAGLSDLQGHYYHSIRLKKVRVGGQRVEVRDIFETASTKYWIPLIEYTSATRRQIHQVFNLYNRQGKHLNAEEMRNALYHTIELTRAIAFAAGDASDPTVVPSLASMEADMLQLGKNLAEYGFGTARFGRTKVLSWLLSILLAEDTVGEPKLRSTAQQTNALLDRVEQNPTDPLRRPESIRAALGLVALSVRAHRAVKAWAPQFMDNKAGAKWQELQLIASLLGVTLAGTVLGDQLGDRLADVEDTLLQLTATEPWLRPDKTQTVTQWAYIARVALLTLETLGVDEADVSAALKEKFGTSCLRTLRRAAASST